MSKSLAIKKRKEQFKFKRQRKFTKAEVNIFKYLKEEEEKEKNIHFVLVDKEVKIQGGICVCNFSYQLTE